MSTAIDIGDLSSSTAAGNNQPADTAETLQQQQQLQQQSGASSEAPATTAPATHDDNDDNDDDTDSIVDGEPVSLVDSVYNFAAGLADDDGQGTTAAAAGERNGNNNNNNSHLTPEEAEFDQEVQAAQRYSAIGWLLIMLFLLWFQLESPSAGFGDDAADTTSSFSSSPSSSLPPPPPASVAALNYSGGKWQPVNASGPRRRPPHATMINNNNNYDRITINRGCLKLIFLVPLLLLLLHTWRWTLRSFPLAAAVKAFCVSYMTAFWIVIPICTIAAAILTGLFSLVVPPSVIPTDPHTTHFGGAPVDTSITGSLDKVRELFAVSAQVFSFVLCCELAKVYFYETTYARSRLRTPYHYNVYGVAVALGFACLECIIAAGFDRVNTSFLATIESSSFYSSSSSGRGGGGGGGSNSNNNPFANANERAQRSRRVALYLWWACFCVVSMLSNVLTSYLIGMSLARRDMRIINSVQETLQAGRVGEAAEGTGGATEEEIRNGINGLDDEHKPLRRPFAMSLVFRTLVLCSAGIMMDRFFYLFPERAWDAQRGVLSAWPKLGAVICPAVVLVLMIFFTVYVVAYEKAMLPASYLKVTGGIATALPGLERLVQNCCCCSVFFSSRLWLSYTERLQRRVGATTAAVSVANNAGGSATVNISGDATAATTTAISSSSSSATVAVRIPASAAADGEGADVDEATQMVQQQQQQQQQQRRRVELGSVVGWGLPSASTNQTRNAATENVNRNNDDDDDDDDDDGDSAAEAGESDSVMSATQRQERESRRLQLGAQRHSATHRHPESVFVVNQRPMGYIMQRKT